MSWRRKLILFLISLWLLAQDVGPRLYQTWEIQFESSCYTGQVRYVDRIGSTCGSGTINEDTTLGFPFSVFSNDLNAKTVAVILDALPLIVLGLAYWIEVKGYNQPKSSK